MTCHGLSSRILLHTHSPHRSHYGHASSNNKTFRPLAPILEFESEEEALTLANDTEFGLAGYFFSKDIGCIMRVASRLECGMEGVNKGKTSTSETLFGGIQESGYGREGSKYGMAEYEVIKSVIISNLNH
jgi:succinate-semialdehyde dehydrogenase/glutarate-semialdehyde dehydrogenase